MKLSEWGLDLTSSLTHNMLFRRSNHLDYYSQSNQNNFEREKKTRKNEIELNQSGASEKQEKRKKRSDRHKHSALAVVRRSQKFSPRRRPLPGGAGQPKFNELEMVTTFTYKPSLVRIDARNFELSS